MRDPATPHFRKETYNDDLLEFTGKSFDSWQAERLKWRGLYGDNYDDVASIQGYDFNKVTHKGLIECYNHPSRLAEVYTNTALWIVHSRFGFENLDNPIFKFFKYNLCHSTKQLKVFDHGCKDGSRSWSFWNQGYDVTIGDLPLQYLKFIDWRIKKYSIPDIEVIIIEVELNYLGDRMFDLIWSREVMEHCVNSHKVLAYLSDYININGFLFLNVSFTGGQYHLMRNHDLFCIEPGGVGNSNGNKRWKQCLKDAGLDEYPIKIQEDLADKAPYLFIKKRPVDWSKFDFE